MPIYLVVDIIRSSPLTLTLSQRERGQVVAIMPSPNLSMARRFAEGIVGDVSIFQFN